MKCTLAEIQGIDRSLPSLTRQQLPIKLSYRLSKLISFCAKEMEAMESARMNLVKKYSEDPTKEGEIRVKPENESKFREEFAEFLKTEVEVDFEPINIQELGEIRISPIDLFRLEKVIVDVKQPEPE